MNSNLIDQHLIDLLRIPADQRTQAIIAEAINRIGDAAQLDAPPLSSIHQEHSKLAAIVEFLAQHLKITRHDTSLDIRESQAHSLWTIMSDDSNGLRLVGSGNTSEEVLKDLHPVKANKDAV